MRDVVRAAEWSSTGDASSFLSDFVQRHKLPKLAMVTKGQYLNVGAPNVAAPTINPYVLIYSAAGVKKLIGRLVKWRDNRIISVTDQQVALNDAFRGYFEILSEGGRPTRCLESVKELVDVFPDVCVVRQNCKAYLAGSDGEMTSSPFYKSRTVKEGEILTLVGRFNFRSAAFLRCFDENGKSVFLKITATSGITPASSSGGGGANNAGGGAKHKFSPVVMDGEAIVGAHKASSLAQKRLPITVRMIAGTPQSHLAGNHVFPVIRLEKLLHEEDIFVYSLSNNRNVDGQFLKVPASAHLMLAPISNHAQMISNPSYQILLNKCFQIYTSLQDRISHFSGLCLTSSTEQSSEINNSSLPKPAGETDIDKDSGINDEEIDELYDYIRGVVPATGAFYTTKDDVIKSPILRTNNSCEKQQLKDHRKVMRLSNETPCKLTVIESNIAKLKLFSSKSTDKLAHVDVVQKPPRKSSKNSKGESTGRHPAKVYYFGDRAAGRDQDDPTLSGHSDQTKPKSSHQSPPSPSRQRPVKNQPRHHYYYNNKQQEFPVELQKCRQDKQSRVYKSCHNLLDANYFWENELYLKQSRHLYQY